VKVGTTTAIEHRSPKYLRLQIVLKVVRHALFMCDSEIYSGQVAVSVVSASMNALWENA